MTLKTPIQFNTAFGNYSATEIIGEGGSARVYKATDDAGQNVAIKRLDPAKATAEKIKRFKNEYLFCANNQHQNIVPVLDNGLVDDGAGSTPFFVMPLYGGSLRNLLDTTIAPDDVLPYFGQILNGVEAAHLKNVVHRDLKPENILHDYDSDTLLIADFGIAWFAEDDLYTLVETQENARLANFQYAAPEQRDRGAKVDHHADIYSLGCILNEMFTGEIPYGTEYKTIEHVASEFQYLDVVVDQMLRRDPRERQANIREVKNQLIAQKNDFIRQQRISELTNTVVPVNELDDPLIVDPPELVEFDWDTTNLTLKLSRPVNRLWVQSLHNMGDYASLVSFPPERFNFSGNESVIPAREHEIRGIIEHFKKWLPMANAVYKKQTENAILKAGEMERRDLQQELEKEQARQRVLRDIKI